jgi:F1F0 ATPase subunit 2
MDYYLFIIILVAGLGLGIIFYGGLYLTVGKLRDYPNPGLVALISFILRTIIVMAGFFTIIRNSPKGIIPGLIGFFISMLVIRIYMSAAARGEKLVPITGNESRNAVNPGVDRLSRKITQNEINTDDPR